MSSMTFSAHSIRHLSDWNVTHVRFERCDIQFVVKKAARKSDGDRLCIVVTWYTPFNMFTYKLYDLES